MRLYHIFYSLTEYQSYRQRTDGCASKRVSVSYQDGNRTFKLRPCKSRECFDCELFSPFMVSRFERLLFRAMSNLNSLGIALYFITIVLEKTSGDSVEDWRTLRRKWPKLLEKWRNGEPLHWLSLATDGQFKTPHYHIVATCPLEKSLPGLRVDCQLIGSNPDKPMKDHIAHVIRYMARNARQLSPSAMATGKRIGTSKDFSAWANGAIYNRLQSSPYITSGTFNTPSLKSCSVCGKRYPATTQFFASSGKRLRGECWQCLKYSNMSWHANVSSRLIGASGHITPSDIAIVAKSQRDQRGRLLDYWTGQPITGDMQLDHIVALSNGGSNEPSNLCITAAKMNASKGNRQLSSWLSVLASKGIRHELTPSDMPIQTTLPMFQAV